MEDLYESHSELEVFQLMVKLFNLELKADETLAPTLDIRAIMHDVNAIRVNRGIPLIVFVKSLYPTYTHYLESLKSSVQLKAITFDSLMDKFTKWDKYFWKRKMTSPYK